MEQHMFPFYQLGDIKDVDKTIPAN